MSINPPVLSNSPAFLRVRTVASVSLLLLVTLFLAGWTTGPLVLASWGAKFVPVAPNTAFGLGAVGLFFLVRRSESAPARAGRLALAVTVLLVTGVSVVVRIFDLGDGLDRIVTPRNVGATRIGLMAIPSGASLHLAAIGLIAAETGCRRTRALAFLSVFAIGATVALGYAFQTPFLYATHAIPMALGTAVGLMLAAVADLADAGTHAWPVSAMTGDSTRARLLRAFLPLTVGGFLVADLTTDSFVSSDWGNPALFSAFVIVVASAAIAASINRVSVSIAAKIEQAQAERRALLESQFRQSQKMDVIGQLAGGVAHDFNNLLTVILSYGRFVLDALPAGELHEDQREVLAAADRAASLTQQLLAFSRKEIVDPQILDLNEVLASTQKMLQRLLGGAIEVRLEPAPDLGHVRMDRGHVDQVLMNLAVNARDAMPDGGTITIRTANDGDRVVVSVTDTGIGMDEATQKRIFEPFFTTKDVGRGTGLGLSTVYGIVAEAGGIASVESKPGAGSTFRVALPRTEKTEAIAVADSAVIARAGNATILLVEDEAPVRAIVRRILRGAGFTVLEAAHPLEALEIARKFEGRIDLLLTDVVMPHMSGFELSDALLAGRPELPFVLMTGFIGSEMPERVRSAIVVNKPFTSAALTNAVNRALTVRSRPAA